MLTAAEKTEVRLTEEPRLLARITQHVQAVAFGSPSEARVLGRMAVDEHDEDLRQLADS
jgi:hypothetical protein